MAIATRTAEIEWTGSVARGGGEITLTDSQAAGPLPVSLAKRAEASDHTQTNPEELIAAAHASCYAMAFANVLSQAKTPPERLHVTARVTLDQVGEGFAITRSQLEVEGRVEGVDEDGFQDAARTAEQACPVSNALRNNVDIELTARLG
jgi:osmotically inducible protein OsmC